MILLCFLLIILISLGFNQLDIRLRSKHDEVLTTSYELRMNTQKIVTQVSSQGRASASAGTSAVGNDSLDLTASIEKFGLGLEKLKQIEQFEQGVVDDLLVQTAIIHATYPSELVQISENWSEFLSNWAAYKNLSESDPSYGSVRRSVMNSLTALLGRVDTFSNSLEALGDVQDKNQQKGQYIYLGFGLLLLTWGSYVIIMRVIRPLVYLDGIVRKMGQGQMEQPIQVTADDELGRLSRSFEYMRTEILASQKLLEARVAERTRVLTAAFEFSQEIVAQPDMKNIVASVSERAKDLMHAKFSSLCLIPDDISKTDSNSKMRKPTTGSLIQKNPASQNGNPDASIVCQNHSIDPTVTLLSTPLQVGGLSIGCLCVARDKLEPFSELDIHTLKLLANSTAVVIANLRLIDSERHEAELNATLTERQRIASELHDEAAQTLSLLNLKVSELDGFTTLEKERVSSSALPQFNALIEKAQSQMRMAFSGLNAPVVAKSGDLRSDLQHYLAEFERSSGITIELLADDLSTLNIPVLVQKQIVYIYREALTNVKRYSHAKKGKVILQRVDDGIHISINDDGVGFDPNITRSDHHFGLSVMQMRTERIGGALMIETAPGKGTSVAAFIPLTANVPSLLTTKETI